MTRSPHGPLRVGVGGPVGSGKTALMDALCKRLRARYDVAAITNDIYTKEDAEFLTRSGALSPERILGVETGGKCRAGDRLDGGSRVGDDALTVGLADRDGAHTRRDEVGDEGREESRQ